MLLHLLHFLLPALALGALLAAWLRWRQPSLAGQGWKLWGVFSALGSACLVAGLLAFGRDGKMLSYAALVLACATLGWWWERRAGGAGARVSPRPRSARSARRGR